MSEKPIEFVKESNIIRTCTWCDDTFKIPYVGPNAKWRCNCGHMNSFDKSDYEKEKILDEN